MLVSVIGVSIGPWLKSANSTITDALDGHPGYTVGAVPNSTTCSDTTFFDEGLVFTDAAAFLEQRPATQSFEALETCEVLCVPRAALYAAYDSDHAIERFGRLMLEAALTGSQRRAGSLLTLNPEQLYRRFVETRPEVARRVPQYLIASYLGITPEALSRIRGRIAKR